MGGLSKSFALILSLIMVISCLSLITKPASAQSIPTPSVPQFTVKFVNASYIVTTTNPYTGESETQQISNNSIEVTIKNQPFHYSNNGSTYQIHFNVRAKPHFTNTDNWTEVYPLENGTSSYNENNNTLSFAEYISPDSPTQSNSSYTVITFPVVPTEFIGASGYDILKGQGGSYFLSEVPGGGKLDFQVEALVGHNSSMWILEHPTIPIPYEGYYAPATAFDLTSGWSNKQTITISASASTSTSPTPTVPEFPSSLVILIVFIAVSSIAVLVTVRKSRIIKAQKKKM